MRSTGFDEKDLIFVPIVGLTGDNIKEPVSGQTCNWYKGPTLLEVLDQVKLEPRFPEGPLRIPILDKMKDPNLIVHGKIENGNLIYAPETIIFDNGECICNPNIYQLIENGYKNENLINKTRYINFGSNFMNDLYIEEKKILTNDSVYTLWEKNQIFP